ncbi:MAG: thioredoxin-disulfide reductase [Desulfobacterales bacterium]|nr:thioredoxin-disulfide reductase [Desulfobacterales bacterium]MCP4161001.1 thioredoxin-disulfide reductase [Deltaproteobacteria bacterium]
MTKTDYDLVIIGGGPAGLTAGMYAARARLNVVLIEMAAPGGQVLVTDWVENYPGFPEGITGFDLVDKMAEQAKKFDLEIITDEVMSLDTSNPVKKIKLSEKEITCHAVIITTGASPKKLGVPGESNFFGKGISFCATCDAPFFKEKTVVAVGGGDTAVQEAVFLTKFVNKVYLVHRRDELRATKILQERAFANDKIEFVWDSVVTGFEGLFGIDGVNVKNLKTNEEKKIAADGCFIWVGIDPNTTWLGDSVETEYGFIVVNDHMETSVPGVFAAGDVRKTPLKQIVTAVGDSAIAAVSAEHYLDNLER